ncbi:ABC transporter ATP-binding protein [Lawsonia intracellularis]|uniref:ABC-type multidrug transport system, ATPase component n=1 Tax=Lawsonia intracellularis (strain PHE/MN1-00) TaxID=363253 RepID=Q1MPR8_LAWIP|nr:ABC transporter ATP-binding protein [Lawsonia intracellularis]AGC50383.1 ABC transporter [Lawsonia intracellularis N343]KAA0204406.1 ABC transporter ATP-binding protein [Lawsonia intracellularis]MBZ3892830.1 ABC transporter ATP-binding protein [Lawsonia intracellularis]OMQ02853.1 ABC transporter ATP-binding protein [Lawsonia intracellularis]RBN33009.1 ABC transporter ATP-binding protein [Lawsonia intracellularis]
MLLQLIAISKVYSNRPILKNISLNITSNTITYLTGENGAGKSTLLKIMAGLLKPTSGEIIFNCSLEEIGYLGHTPFIYQDLSAYENLLFWGRLYKKRLDKKQIATAIEQMKLTRFIYERTRTFSRGMLQRLNFARVLMLKPKLLLLDEPESGLDNQSLSICYNEIINAKTAGAGIVWISHNLIKNEKVDQHIILKNKKIEYTKKEPYAFQQ